MVTYGACEVEQQALSDLEVGPRFSGDALEQEIGPERCPDEPHVLHRDVPWVDQRHAAGALDHSRRDDVLSSLKIEVGVADSSRNRVHHGVTADCTMGARPHLDLQKDGRLKGEPVSERR